MENWLVDHSPHPPLSLDPRNFSIPIEILISDVDKATMKLNRIVVNCDAFFCEAESPRNSFDPLFLSLALPLSPHPHNSKRNVKEGWKKILTPQ